MTLCLAVAAWGLSRVEARAQQTSSAESPGTSSASGEGEQILLPAQDRPAPIVTSHHADIENYASGDVKVRRQVNVLSDETWINHGQFVEYYKNGQKFAEGRYENGARIGEWTYWYEDGKPCKTVQYRDGVPHGAWTVHRPDGTRSATRQYVRGEPHGIWTQFAKDGETVIKEETYENGLAHGEWVERFESGKPRSEGHYERGKRHGKYTEWDEQGKVVREMSFKEGRLDGRAVVRGAGGREIIQHYRDGQLLLGGPESGGQ
jgi:antitoxin component YwqK of YwqJK toxin-antitoxin module